MVEIGGFGWFFEAIFGAHMEHMDYCPRQRGPMLFTYSPANGMEAHHLDQGLRFAERPAFVARYMEMPTTILGVLEWHGRARPPRGFSTMIEPEPPHVTISMLMSCWCSRTMRVGWSGRGRRLPLQAWHDEGADLVGILAAAHELKRRARGEDVA